MFGRGRSAFWGAEPQVRQLSLLEPDVDAFDKSVRAAFQGTARGPVCHHEIVPIPAAGSIPSSSTCVKRSTGRDSSMNAQVTSTGIEK